MAVTGGVGFLLQGSFWKPLESRLVSSCLPLPPVGPSRIKHRMMQGWVGCTFSLITCQRVRASEGNVKRYHYLNPLSSKISHGLKGGETHTCDWFNTTRDGLGNGCVTKAQIDTIPQTHDWPQWIHTLTVSMTLSSSQRDALLNRCLLGLTHQCCEKVSKVSPHILQVALNHMGETTADHHAKMHALNISVLRLQFTFFNTIVLHSTRKAIYSYIVEVHIQFIVYFKQ